MFDKNANQQDYYRRGIVGFTRSSPLYNFPMAKYVSEAYFLGYFPTGQEKHLVELGKEAESLITERIFNREKQLPLPKSCANNFVDILLAYLHSPLQTRKARRPMQNKEAKRIFDELVSNLPLFYFVQKVAVDSHPKRTLVSIISIRLSNRNHFYFQFLDLSNDLEGARETRKRFLLKIVRTLLRLYYANKLVRGKTNQR